MEVIEYNGKRVYTNLLNSATKEDLKKAKTENGSITDVYFFQLTGDRLVERIDFDRKKIENLNSGLHVEVNLSGWGVASVSIAGLDNIVKFLCDATSLGKDLSVLSGRKVKTYSSGMQLLGIELEN